MVTIKLPYTTTPDKSVILGMMNNQSWVTKFLFNRLKDADGVLTQKELTSFANSMNNISVDSWFKQSSVYEAKAIYGSYKSKLTAILEYNKNHPGELKKLPTVIFGSRKLFFDRCKKKISREEFIKTKGLPLVSVGETLQYGNRKFEFKVIEENKITFKPEYGIKIPLQLPKLRKNYKKILSKLQVLMEQKKIPVKVSLDPSHIYVTYDEKFIKSLTYKPVMDRIMSIDMNPNYIGWSIIDHKYQDNFKILRTGVVSIKKLNDKQFSFKKEKLPSDHPQNIKINNQRDFEIFEVSKALANVAVANNVKAFGLEGLNMPSSNKGKGKKYNRLVNNMWCREAFESNLKKRLTIAGIIPIEVYAAYTSYVGNLLYRQFPDMVGASIEISRRAYLKLNKKEFVLFPSFTGSIGALTQSLEELGLKASKLIQNVKDWKELCGKVKNSKVRYRVPLDRFRFKVFRLDCSPWVEQFLSFTTV
jgi:hypothetical protein